MKPRYLTTVLALMTMVACVDEEFRLDQVSTQVTTGGNVTTIPLGYLEKKNLEEIINLDDLEGLQLDENGNYALTFQGEDQEISVDGIEHTVHIPKTAVTFSTQYPDFELSSEACTINQLFRLTPNFGTLNIPLHHTISVPAGYTITTEEELSVREVLQYTVPEHLSAIKRIYLKPQAAGEKGARIELTLDLADLAAINGGGHIDLELIANDGYELYDRKGNTLPVVAHQGNLTTYHIAENYPIAAGSEQIEFVIYVASIANVPTITNNLLSIPFELGYRASFDLQTRANTITLKQLPELKINASLQYQDADIVLNEVMLLEHSALADKTTSFTIDNLPQEVKSIRQITFSDHSPLHLFAEGLDWLEETTAEHVIVEATLPSYLTLHAEQQLGYDATTHTLRTNLSKLRHQIPINLDALHFAGEGITPQEGTITMEFTPDIVAYIEQGTETKLSKILHDKAIQFTAGFDESALEVVSMEGKIAYRYEDTTTIEMGGIQDDKLYLTIANAGVSPVITIQVDNPLTIDAEVSAQITPIFDGVAKQENSIAIDRAVIKAATLVNGSIQRGHTTLVLAEEALRQNYTDPKYTFVACDLGKLLIGEIPDAVVLDFALATNEETVHALHITDSYSVNYSYDVSIPLAFNNDLDITIEETIDGLSDIFADLVEQDISFDGISLIAEVVSTIPVDFTFDATLLTAQGSPSTITLDFPESANRINGSTDGKTETTSTLRISLNMGKNANIKQLAEVDAIRFSLNASRSNEGRCALHAKQYCAQKFMLEIDGHITADLEDLFD